MNEDIYADYIVKRKRPGWVIPAYLGVGVLLLFSLILTMNNSWGFLAFVVVILGIMYGNRFTKIEYGYEFITDELLIDAIYSQNMRKRRKKIEMSQILSVDYTNPKLLENRLADKNVTLEDYTSHEQDCHSYTITYTQGGKTCLLNFEPNEKMLQVMRRCSPSKVHIQQ